MAKKTDIIFENNLLIEKRDLNVYHRKSKGIHFISRGSTVMVPLQTANDDDFVYLSVAVGPGYMERQNIVDLPSCLNYEFQSEGKFAAIRTGDRTLLKIPAGLPEWKLKLTLSASNLRQSCDRVIISDRQDVEQKGLKKEKK
jgi:hypothetical protein